MFWLFKSRRKGWLVFPILIGSFLGIFSMAWLISSLMGETSDEHTEHIFSGLALIISGILVQRFTRNYYISPDGSKVYFEQEGYFMHVGVSFWQRVFIGLGLIFIAGTLADKYLL